MKKKVYLTLKNGKVFQGYRFGAKGEVIGELVFSTGGVDNCLVELTDPAYYGQILLNTFPLIGNYGVVPAEFEYEKPCVSAYVVREVCDEPSNFRCEGKLDDYLKKEGIVGIYGVDTRELTKIIRENGVMSAYIGDKPLQDLSILQEYSIKNAVEKMTCKESATYGDENAKYTVAFVDYGSKKSDVEQLTTLGVKVIKLPATTTAEEILSLDVDGVVLSAGPGNPAENTAAIEEIKKLVGKKPVLGVSLGFQMLALALGAQTTKMKTGHRGGQPVNCLDNGRVYISAQNHGYEVLASSVVNGKVNYVNVNDGSVEGIEYPELNAYGVQFDPAALSVACQTNILYEKFLAKLK